MRRFRLTRFFTGVLSSSNRAFSKSLRQKVLTITRPLLNHPQQRTRVWMRSVRQS
nr:MAG TPA: hypothetical protein [Bacteriophage sp.]